jgi:alginate O-acetyltransferase complex protein AlgI
MLYTSALYPALLVFALLVYWVVAPSHRRKHVLAFASLGWLGFLNWRSAAPFVALTIVVFLCGRALVRGRLSSSARQRVLLSGLVLPIAHLATFKYLPEYSLPIKQMLETLRADETLLLPLGISYYTFRFISYLIEARRGTLPTHGFVDFLCYVSLFTTFPAGPIDRFGRIQPQLTGPAFDSRVFAAGLERILFGAAKKVILADFLILGLQDRFARLPDDPSLATWNAQVAFLWCRFLFLYFDFSGYSDIAIGTSRLFGLQVMENFDWPLLRRNISEFWRSWHISLSSWCRDYVYFPVFGLTRNPKLAVYASMLVLGYWHGANPKWLLWGAWHATGLAIWQSWQVVKRRHPALMHTSQTSRVYRFVAVALTLNFVALGGVWTAFDSPLMSLRYLYYLFMP